MHSSLLQHAFLQHRGHEEDLITLRDSAGAFQSVPLTQHIIAGVSLLAQTNAPQRSSIMGRIGNSVSDRSSDSRRNQMVEHTSRACM
jgi:hypothetical protein